MPRRHIAVSLRPIDPSDTFSRENESQFRSMFDNVTRELELAIEHLAEQLEDRTNRIPARVINDDYTFTLADAGRRVRASTGSFIYTIDSTLPWRSGDRIEVSKIGTGTITVRIIGGASLRHYTGSTVSMGNITVPEGGWLDLTRLNQNFWEARGNF